LDDPLFSCFYNFAATRFVKIRQKKMQTRTSLLLRRRCIKVFIFVFFVAFGILGMVRSSQAASTYYVDNSVVSNGNGSLDSPWKNLSDINWTIISGASKPCTIYISGATTSQTYNEQLLVGASGSNSIWPYDGTPTGEIIIKRPSEAEWPGHSGEVYLRNNTNSTAIDVSNRSNIIIDGIDFRQTYPASENVALFGYPADHIVIRNCRSSMNQGSTVAGIGNYWSVQNNDFSPNYTNLGNDLIGPDGSHWLIEKNILHAQLGPRGSDGNHGDCVHFGVDNGGNDYIIRHNLFRVTETAFMIYLEPMSTGPLTNVRIYGNVFESYATTGGNFSAIDMDPDLGGANNYSTSWIFNNTFINCNNNNTGGGFGAIYYRPNTNPNHRIYIKNNIFYNSLVLLEGSNTNGQIAAMDNNLYYTDGTQISDIIQYGPSSRYTTAAAFHAAHQAYEANGKTGNPNLYSVNNSSGIHDPRLTASSMLAIDQGDSSIGADYASGLENTITESAWPSQVLLYQRAGLWDIGAYEYVSNQSDTTAPASPSGLTVW
jgi:hypothetical protein